MNYPTLRDAVSYALRDVHRDLAIADGPHYNPDPGDPRAVDVLLRFLAMILESEGKTLSQITKEHYELHRQPDSH